EEKRDNSVRRGWGAFRERRTRLDTQEIVIVVVEEGKVHVELGPYQASVSGFVANQAFRGKLSVADDPQKSRWIRRQQCGDLEVFFNSGRSAHGASDGSPHGLP